MSRWFSLTHFTLRSRILLTSLVVTLGLTFLSIVLAVREYQHDKLAYLHELHAARTSTASANVREALVWLSRNSAQTPWPGQLPQDLQRQPYDNEIFVAKSSYGMQLFHATRDGEIMSQPLDAEAIQKALEPVTGIPLMLVSQAGEVILEQRQEFSPTESKSIIMGVFNSQLTEGQTVFQINGSDVVIGFREVSASNLIVITFTPLANMLAPLQDGLRAWAAISIPILILGLVVQAWILGGISRPLRQMVAFFQTLSEGNFSAPIATTRGEFGPVFAGAAALQRAVANREERLKLFAAGLNSTLDFARNPDLARDTRKAADRLTELLGQIISLHPRFGTLVFEEPAEVLWIRQSHSKWASSEEGIEHLRGFLRDPHLKTGGIVKRENEATPAEALLIPIVNGSERKGLILIPVAADQELAEIWNLAPVITNALTEMISRCMANDLARQEASVAHELSLARQVQERSLMLDNIEIPGLWIDTLFDPAEMVGGDWMGVFPHLHAGIVNVYIGDVTGHGIGSAFHTSLISGAVMALEDELEQILSAQCKPSPGLEMRFQADEYLARTWHRLNRVFLESAVGKSMTMLMMSVDVTRGHVAVLRAGHPAPLWIGANPDSPPPRGSMVVKATPPLGSPADEADVRVETFTLRKGDCILGFTDGFHENITLHQGKIGSRTVREAARKVLSDWDEKSEPQLQRLHQWTLTAGDGYDRADDVALIALKYLGISP